jgi:hypothetical protein
MTNSMKRMPVLTLGVTLLLAAMFSALVASHAQAALTHREGTVLSKNSQERTFRIKTENGNRIRFRVNGNTEFQRIPGGFSGLHRGLDVEVLAKRHLAKKVEKHRRGGSGSGSGGGGDDGPNHA